MKWPTDEEYEEAFLYDLALSRRRIGEEGKKYGINSRSDLILKPQDFEKAQKMYDLKSKIVRDEGGNITEEGVFRGILYCSLASFQDYKRQKDVFDALVAMNPDAPGSIMENENFFSKTIKGVMFNNQKADRIIELSREWENLNIYQKILEGIGDSMGAEILTKDYLAENAAGLDKKTASLLLRICGTKHLVPVDTIMQGMLYFHGYPTEIERITIIRKDEGNRQKLRKKGITKKEYPAYVRYTEDLAGKYGVLDHELQLAYWVTKSSYSKLKTG